MNIRAGTASGYLEEDDVAKAIIYAVNNGARIINMSFGDVVASQFLQDIIQYAYSHDVFWSQLLETAVVMTYIIPPHLQKQYRLGLVQIMML